MNNFSGYIKDELITESILDKGIFKAVFMSGSPGSGKAQPLSSLILTIDGWKKMGDIKIGDKIITPNNTIATVIEEHPQGMIPVYKVKLLDGRETRCSAEHLWKIHGIRTKRKRPSCGKRIWSIENTEKIIESLNKSHLKTRCHIPTPTSIDFRKDIKLPIDPYLLGVLLGDGGLTAGVRLTIEDNDIEIINKIKSKLFDCHTISKLKGKTNKYGYTITSNNPKKGSNKYKNILDELGLFGKKSEDKFIPEIYKNTSINDRIELLQGLFDTDGYSSPNAQIYFYSTSKKLIDDVAYIIWSLGDVPFISVKKTGYKKDNVKIDCKDCYIITLQSHNPEKYFSLERKKERASNKKLQKRNINHNLRNKIISIEPDGEDICKCITIDNEDGLYLTDNFIVTHNSYTLSKIKSGQIEPRIVNVDKFIEYFGKNYEEEYYNKSKKITMNQLFLYVNSLLPLFVDVTSSKPNTVVRRYNILENIGYDLAAVHVNCSLEVAIERARKRTRKVDEDNIKRYFEQIEKTKPFLRSKFNLFIEVNNDDGELTDEVILSAFKKIKFYYDSPVKNPIGVETIETMKENGFKYLTPEVYSQNELKSIIDKWYVR